MPLVTRPIALDLSIVLILPVVSIAPVCRRAMGRLMSGGRATIAPGDQPR